jgi:uncharacterized protein YkwD
VIRSLLAVTLMTACLQAQEAAVATKPSTPAELAVVREINKIRRFPREYAKYLRALGTRFEGTLWRLRDHVPIRTNEGRAAIIEAAEYLEKVAPVMELITYDEALHRAALDHVQDQGPTGATGHKGTDGSSPSGRIKRYSGIGGLSAEVINYGDETPRMTVIQLVIDDGVPDRGHRRNLFDRRFRVAGAAIGPHTEYGIMVVVDLADVLTPRE